MGIGCPIGESVEESLRESDMNREAAPHDVQPVPWNHGSITEGMWTQAPALDHKLAGK